MVLRFAAHVPQLELLEAKHVGRPRARGEPVGRRAAEPAETEDDVLVVVFMPLATDEHGTAVGISVACH